MGRHQMPYCFPRGERMRGERLKAELPTEDDVLTGASGDIIAIADYEP